MKVIRWASVATSSNQCWAASYRIWPGKRAHRFDAIERTATPGEAVISSAGPWDETARSALALAKMDWNNDALYDMLPVTMAYAKTLARVVKRMDGLGSAPYQFRFFM
jgi:hypothetical protein